MLTKRQKQLLAKFGLSTDFEHLTDEQHFAIDERMSNEMMTKEINDSGDGLNDYGELCESVIIALPDDPVKRGLGCRLNSSREARVRSIPKASIRNGRKRAKALEAK